jgi:hypothetical protein
LVATVSPGLLAATLNPADVLLIDGISRIAEEVGYDQLFPAK